MTGERLTLDTNILIYAVDRDSGKKHTQAIEIISNAIALDCVLTVQALAEFYSAATRKGYASHDDAYAFIKEWTILFPIVDTGGHILTRALAIVKEHNLSFWDAMLWGAAKESGCTIILSEDFQDGRKLDGVLFRNPFKEEYYGAPMKNILMIS